jgi:hypothetical protein
MLPVRPIRAAILSFIGALAIVQVGAGLVVAQAWRLSRAPGGIAVDDRWQLHQYLDRLRVMENVVVAGAVATTLLWTLLAVHNATRAAHGDRRAAVLAVVACIACPVGFVVLRSVDPGSQSGPKAMLIVAQALALYLPFGAVAKASAGVGGPRMPFVRWYLALVASFVVHDVFTMGLDLANPKQSDDLGRTAALFLVNAIVVGVMLVMAAEATEAMDHATTERSQHYRHLHDDAQNRMRGPITVPASTKTLPPPPVSAPVAQVPALASPAFAPPLTPES